MAHKLKQLLIQKISEQPDRLTGLVEANFPIFLKDDIQENFSPSWDEAPMFGRVDSVARYSNTKRTVSFSFYVLALKSQDPPDGPLAINAEIKGEGKSYLQGKDTQNFRISGVNEYSLFDDQTTCVDKIEFLRSLTYPKYDNSVYVQPPMIFISLSNQFIGVQGYITDLSITHQVVSGLGLDLEHSLFMPHGWEVSISFTVLHSQPPTTEGLQF